MPRRWWFGGFWPWSRLLTLLGTGYISPFSFPYFAKLVGYVFLFPYEANKQKWWTPWNVIALNKKLYYPKCLCFCLSQPGRLGLLLTQNWEAHERRLLFKLIWKAAFVWVTPYLVQLTFSLEACSWKNGDLVFQRWSFFSILETCMGIDDPYVKKPRWRRNWNAISKMIKDGLAEGMVTRKLCVEVLDLVLTSFQTSFFSGHHE